MSDERYISEIEDRLRDAGAPPTPPDHLHGIARAEALGQADVVDIRSAVRPSSRFGRLVLAAAVLTASAAAALVIGVGGSGFHAERSINLQGAPRIGQRRRRHRRVQRPGARRADARARLAACT